MKLYFKYNLQYEASPRKDKILTPVIITLCIHWNERLQTHETHSCVCPGSDSGLWLRVGGNVAASLSLWEPWH